MIQRIQSVFLAIVAITMLTSIFMTTWNKSLVTETIQMTASLTPMELTVTQNGETEVTNTIYILIISALSAVVATVSLFSYKNRMKQMKLNFFNTLLIGAVVIINAVFLYLFPEIDKEMKAQLKSGFELAFFLPFVALIFNNMSTKFIRKDEQLVRSVDRLR